MKRVLTIAALFVATTNSLVANLTDRQVIPLWEKPPGALGNEDKDTPTLTVYLPKTGENTGASVVICPGGGYGSLAPHEGEDYALWLRDNGITGFVLKYRLGSAGYRHPVPLQDVSRALRLVRANASQWSLDPNRVGVMGSSAGGHLASTLLTHFDAGNSNAEDVVERQNSRPDFGILCYPVITMGEKTHGGSKKNLLGPEPSPELVRELSNELHVTANTPPCFIYHTVEDKAVVVENSLMFASALTQAGVEFDLHIYQKGPHGSGLGFAPRATYQKDNLHPWAANCIFWLKQRGIVK